MRSVRRRRRLHAGVQPLLEFGVGLQDPVARCVLRRRIDDRTQEGEASPFAIHAVLPRRKRDVPAAAAAPLPDRDRVAQIGHRLGAHVVGRGIAPSAKAVAFFHAVALNGPRLPRLSTRPEG